MTNILGMSPPDPPADVPPLKPRLTDPSGNVRDQTMRQKMLDHRVRADCIQCHRLMDPIGFALENFDALGAWRTSDSGFAVDPRGELVDGTKVDGPASLRQSLVKHSDAFLSNFAGKLLTYALGRGVESYDMPAVRAICREAARDHNRFSAFVLGIVRSTPFQMRNSGAGLRSARVLPQETTDVRH